MEKSKLYLLPLCFLVLTACQPNKDNSGGDIPPAKGEKLSTPVLTVNNEGTGLTWAAVEGAVSYSISVNEAEAVSVNAPGYDFAEEAGEYAVKVVAVASDTELNSEQASFDYSTIYTALSAVAFDEDTGRITWSGFHGAGLKYSINGGEEVAVEGDYIEVETGGLYDITAVGGFVAEGNKYYVNNETSVNVQHIIASPKMAQAMVLEDGSEDSNADLQAKYDALYYGTSGWQPSANAVATLDRNNEGISPNRSFRAMIFCNGSWFKWLAKEAFVCEGSVDSLSFYAKAAAPSQASLYLRWEVTEDLMIGDLNFKGVYVTYKLDKVPTGWHKYTVGMNDANWEIAYNNQKLDFATVKGILATAGYTINSLGEFFQYFGNFAILAKCASTGSGPKGYVYVDEIKLSAGAFEAENKDYEIHEWAFKSSALSNGYFRFSKDNPSVNKLVVKMSAGSKISLVPQVEVEDTNVLHVVVTGTYDLDARFTVGADGKLTLNDGATGAVAAFLTEFSSDLCHVIDDFEDHTETGVGLDGSHKDETTFKGLRSKWYSDYYSGNTSNPSAVGGNGWSMMGSTDYLELNKSPDYAHYGNQSMRLKYNATNQMRFITWDMTQAPAPRLPKATYLSLWVRACDSRVNQIKIKAFFNEQISPVNQGDTSKYTELVQDIAADPDHGWVEVKVTLKPEKNYFGFVLQPMKNGAGTGDDGKYFYVDNIALYNTLSPFGTNA